MRHKSIDDLLEVAKTANNADIKAYVHAHWDEFPTDIQDALAVALMTDAVGDHVAEQLSTARVA